MHKNAWIHNKIHISAYVTWKNPTWINVLSNLKMYRTGSCRHCSTDKQIPKVYSALNNMHPGPVAQSSQYVYLYLLQTSFTKYILLYKYTGFMCTYYLMQGFTKHYLIQGPSHLLAYGSLVSPVLHFDIYCFAINSPIG